MSSLISQDNKKLQSLRGNGNCLPTWSVDYGLHLETALPLGISVDGHMAEVIWTHLVLDNAMVKATASHCVPESLLYPLPHYYVNGPQL